MQQDSLFAKPLEKIVDFKFDEKVARVFPDMVKRSVPGYSTIIAAIGVLAAHYFQDGTRCYDLGCSLGAATLSMRHRLQGRDARIIGVDNSQAMMARCQKNLALDESDVLVDLVCADIRDITIENASVVVLNFTLQFIEAAERLAVIRRIHDGLMPGGILILSEKIAFDDPRTQDLFTELHHAFKRANGYSDLEISQKRAALENVLVPETIARHQSRLSDAGFASADVWFQYLNFASIIAIK